MPVITDDDGRPLILYHGTQQSFTGFDLERMKRDGVHFGTLAQAKMRSGPRGDVVPAMLQVNRLRRLRDTEGGWRKTIAAAKRSGYDGIIYLNRYEGINRSTVMKAINEKVDLDRMTDEQLRRYATELTDSYIVFYPDQIYLV